MNKRTLTKYCILLLLYIIIVRFVQPYALQLHFTMSKEPISDPLTIQTLQSIFTAISIVINLIFVIIMIIDSKGKALIDWLIIVITFFSPEAGITIFIVWQLYKGQLKEQGITG